MQHARIDKLEKKVESQNRTTLEALYTATRLEMLGLIEAEHVYSTIVQNRMPCISVLSTSIRYMKPSRARSTSLWLAGAHCDQQRVKIQSTCCVICCPRALQDPYSHK
jgi:hypothetical protein